MPDVFTAFLMLVSLLSLVASFVAALRQRDELAFICFCVALAAGVVAFRLHYGLPLQ